MKGTMESASMGDSLLRRVAAFTAALVKVIVQTPSLSLCVITHITLILADACVAVPVGGFAASVQRCQGTALGYVHD